MSKCLYIAANQAKSGKSAIVLGVMQLLLTNIRKVAIYRPIIHDSHDGRLDHDIELILKHFNLTQPYETTFTYTQSEARSLINEGNHALLLERIIDDFKYLEENYDFILCEGTDYLGSETALEFDLNIDIVSNLGCPVIAVLNAVDSNADEICDMAVHTVSMFQDKSINVISLMVNRVNSKNITKVEESIAKCFSTDGNPLVYILPDDKRLGNPTIKDVVKWIDCRVLYGKSKLDTLIDDYVVAAMQVENFLKYVNDGSLIITSGDRSDIILASLSSRLSDSYPDVAGILLTGNIKPAVTIHHLIEGWRGVPVPVLVAKGHTYKISQILSGLHGTIDPENKTKVLSALGLFETCVDSHELKQKLISAKSDKITPYMFEHELLHKARVLKQHIVLPEGESRRILQAANIIIRRDVAELTLLGDIDKIKNIASEEGVSLAGINLIDPEKSDLLESFTKKYHDLRKHKGITLEDAKDRMCDRTYFGTMMVHVGLAGGMVSGAVTTTAQTIRPAFEFIKTRPDVGLVSSVFLMCQNDKVMVFGDCAVNPNPDANQLAEIAKSSAETAKIFGIEPRVAMLSYSTGGSGKGKDVDKVMEAIELVWEKAPDLKVEGPLQYDAAVDLEIGRDLMPESEVAGNATVLIFPDLNTGNNTYKAVQRAVPGSVAIGPVLQGLNKPVNDLSRGCRVRDVVNTVAITAIQAQSQTGQGKVQE